ncbi:ribosome 60S biogenesis N-terminal-domain-containing protein [Lentinula novae-zelandiae]|nr:ribosome 60S biogenesis N-terminal-domain-containing protein [Lentinula novae-zelandiae]
MSAGPSQQKWKAGGSKNSEDAHLAFKTPAEIGRALAVGANVDGVVKALSSLRWQFQHTGTHQVILNQWLKSTSAEALLNLWEQLESEGAYGKVLSMIISLLCIILRHLDASSDGDNRLARTLLSPERVAKLNVYLAGRNLNRNGLNTQNATLTVETLNLLAALAAWDPKTVLESLRWDMESFSRILRGSRNRKDGKGKGEEKSKHRHHAESRSRASLLSLVTAMLTENVSARVKSTFLASGTPTLTLLQNILSGVGDSYDEDHHAYSYPQIKNLLETLYAGVWCDKRVAKSVKVNIFTFGSSHRIGMRTEGVRDVKRAGERVWKGLLTLYSRTEHESSFHDIDEGKQTQDDHADEGGIPADLIHHFLLALCTRPGQGVCFRDQGWYSPNHNNKTLFEDEINHDEAHSNSNNVHSSFRPDEGPQKSSRYTIYNPLLLRVLRLLTPMADPRQQELAARIFEACPELVASCPDIISGGPGALDPKLNARWMIGMAWYGRVAGLPVPEESFYLPETGGSITIQTPRLEPPPLRSVLESIMPSFSGGGTKSLLTKALGTGGATENRATQDSTDQNIGYGLGLVQHITALTLCRCLRKLMQVQAAFLQAARAAGELEADAQMGNSHVGDSEYTLGAWTRRLTEVTREVRARLPDIQFVLAFLKRIEAAASPQAGSLSVSSTIRTANPTALTLLSESAHRLVWLYHACFVSASSPSTPEGLGRFDVGGLMANLSIFSAEEPNKQEVIVVASELDGLQMMKDIHIIRTLRLSGEFGSRAFGKIGNLKLTPFHLLLQTFARGSVSHDGRKVGHHVLLNEICGLLEQVLAQSLLFRHNEGMDSRYRGGAEEEVRVWLAALADTTGFDEADTIVTFVDECVQRCTRTPERYLDALEEVRDANISNIPRWSEDTTPGVLPSPLLMTLLEQLGHRIHATSIQEQQQSFDSAKCSLRALLSFVKSLFIRLAALCEPRALPVLQALAEKVTIGKNSEDVTKSDLLGFARTEISNLRTLLEFNHTCPGLGHITVDPDFRGPETGNEGFEILFAERCSAVRLANPSWRSKIIEKIFVGSGAVRKIETTKRVSTILHATRLISHSLLALRDSHENRDVYMQSLILLLAELMAKSNESSELSLPMKQLVTEYVFCGNEAYQEFWTSEESRGATQAIDYLLCNSGLNDAEAADRALLGEILEHWVSYLRTQLQNPTPGPLNIDSVKTDPKFALALMWLQYAHPHALCDLFDLAYSCRSQPAVSEIAESLISATVETLGRHARMVSAVETYMDSEPFAFAVELRRRLSVLLTLSSEGHFDSAVLEELVSYALQSRLPIGYDGVPSSLLFQHSIHFRRRYHWKQRLGNVQQNMPNSDVFERHYFSHNSVITWSDTTSKVVCSAIYSGCIQLAALNKWLIRLSRAPTDAITIATKHLVPILHAHLDCVYVSGALSDMNDEQRREFWQAYEAHFSSLLDLTFCTLPTLSAEQKLTRFLMERIRALSMDEMSLELLAIGKRRGRSLDEGFSEVGDAVIDHALQWTVRMLTGCREIQENDVRLLSELANVIGTKSTIKSHLAEPVLTAVVREHPYSESALNFLDVMLPKAGLKPLIVNRHLQILVQHPHFGKPTSPSARRALINVLYTLFHLHPFNTCQPSHVQPLVILYRGSASVADRKLLAIFRLFEEQRRTSVASLLARWTSSPEGFQSTSAFEALREVDSLLVLRTALHFPQWRKCETDENWEERLEDSEIYDPVFLLLLFAHVLVEDAPKTTPAWVELFRTNIVGLAIRALSAKDDSLRELASTQIAVLWKCLEHAEMLEKPHVFHILSLLRDALRPAHERAPERLSSYTSLLLVHALRGVFYSSNFVYPITARFLLQRPTLDLGDVPMLYGMLYSSAEDHGKKDRAWIVRMLADGMQSSVDWRVFKRRHTWDLLASAFQSEEKERAFRRSVLEVLANLTCITEATMSLLLKSNLLSWVEMQLLTPQEDEGLAWLKILENILVISRSEKLEASTAGEWRACLARCLILLLDACKALRTFPIFHLFSGVLLRLALLPNSSSTHISRILNRCVSAIKDQERDNILLSVAPSTSITASGALFEAPHGAFRLFEVPPLSESAFCEAQGESIEQLWRVAMLVDVKENLPAWDELSSLLLLWRARKGEYSVVGEWARKEAVKNIQISGCV